MEIMWELTGRVCVIFNLPVFSKYRGCLTHICKVFLWNRLKLFHQCLTQILSQAGGEILHKDPRVGEWLRNENEGQVFSGVGQKDDLHFQKETSLFSFSAVDKFRLVIVLRSLFSFILSIKSFHTFHPAQIASFFES